MIPLRDDNPTTLRPYVTVGLIAVCVIVFLWQLSLGPRRAQEAVYSFGLIPAVLFGERALAPEIAHVPAVLTVVTSMFLHSGWLHLLGNMLYLWIFGNNVEDAMGHGRFIAFYLVTGAAAALAQAFNNPDAAVPMIGASGAIAGVLGAYTVLYPRAHVLVLIYLGIFATTVRLPALAVLGFWFVFQFLSATGAGAQEGGVAWWAHLGGFVAGAVLIPFFRRPGIALFAGPTRRGPWG